MRKSLLTVLVVFGVGLLAAQAGAATVFSADFEGLTSGPMPNVADVVAQHFPPAANALPGQAPWTKGGYSSSPTDIEPWFNDSFVVADPSNASNHVAAFYGDQSSGPVAGSTAGVVMTVDPSKDITFSQQAYYSSTMNAGEQRTLLFTLLNSTGGPFWNGNMNVSFGTYGYYSNIGLTSDQAAWSMYDSNIGTWQSLAVPMDSWTTASVTFHVATKTADFSVVANGVTQQVLGINASYMDMTQTKYNLSVDGNGAGLDQGAILLDSVQISQVPEPMTLTLLALGGGALLRRRK